MRIETSEKLLKSVGKLHHSETFTFNLDFTDDLSVCGLNDLWMVCNSDEFIRQPLAVGGDMRIVVRICDGRLQTLSKDYQVYPARSRIVIEEIGNNE